VALAITDISEERTASNIKVARIGEPRKSLAVTSNRRMLRRFEVVQVIASPFLHMAGFSITGFFLSITIYGSGAIFKYLLSMPLPID
jgi:hypothetical protein